MRLFSYLFLIHKEPQENNLHLYSYYFRWRMVYLFNLKLPFAPSLRGTATNPLVGGLETKQSRLPGSPRPLKWSRDDGFFKGSSFHLGILLLFMMISVNQTSLAKDFGIYGHQFTIVEIDLLKYIEQKLSIIGQDQLAAHQQKIKTKLVSQIQSPRAITTIGQAQQYKKYYYDPTITVEQDIKDINGNLIHKAGSKINPLTIKPFTSTWIIIDGRNAAQIEFAKTLANKNSKIILVAGNPGKQADGSFYYFDQAGSICKQLSIKHTPSIVKQQGELIEIEEVPL